MQTGSGRRALCQNYPLLVAAFRSWKLMTEQEMFEAQMRMGCPELLLDTMNLIFSYNREILLGKVWEAWRSHWIAVRGSLRAVEATSCKVLPAPSIIVTPVHPELSSTAGCAPDANLYLSSSEANIPRSDDRSSTSHMASDAWMSVSQLSSAVVFSGLDRHSHPAPVSELRHADAVESASGDALQGSPSSLPKLCFAKAQPYTLPSATEVPPSFSSKPSTSTHQEEQPRAVSGGPHGTRKAPQMGDTGSFWQPTHPSAGWNSIVGESQSSDSCEFLSPLPHLDAPPPLNRNDESLYPRRLSDQSALHSKSVLPHSVPSSPQNVLRHVRVSSPTTKREVSKAWMSRDVPGERCRGSAARTDNPLAFLPEPTTEQAHLVMRKPRTVSDQDACVVS